MGDAAKRFLHATHLYWQFLDEANRMPELPPPWVCPLQCWWPRSTREPKMESAAYWPDDEGDRHRARGPSIDDLERLAEEAGREAGVWEHSSPDVRKKIRTLLEKTIALPLDYDMKAYPAAVDIWFEEYRELKPYGDEPYRAEPMLTKPATVITKPKRINGQSTHRITLIAALEKHHQYANGSCLNTEPIGNNALGKLAGTSGAAASNFFNDKFGGHAKYKILCYGQPASLVAKLRELNDERTPAILDERRGAKWIDPDTLSAD